MNALIISRRMLGVVAAVLVPHLGVHAATEQPYPAKPISVVVGYPAGGSVDAVARAVSDALAKKLDRPIVIENIGGASGAIGVQKVVSAKPDGYTLAFGSNSEFAATAAVNTTQKYDAARDLVPIGYVGSIPLVLVASRQSGITDLNQFISEVRSKPGKYTYGTSGIGSMLHFSGELLKKQGGLSIVHVPYKGASNIASDLTGGTIDFAFMGPGIARPFIESGRMVPIGVTSAGRSPLISSVPALGEHPTLKGYELDGWYALMAPKGTSSEVLDKLRQALKQASLEPDLQQKLARIGVVLGRGNENLPQIITKDAALYKQVATYAGMRD